ncbi:MAG: precorrin-3B C(17)-methyltransferase [Deltaproteobacteria bacterium]|jgi:precorrin-3B C17-methyltransferase|nr:precorrin-3B C(17)-methyltransferase [Deltaproteobacteria bacterium]
MRTDSQKAAPLQVLGLGPGAAALLTPAALSGLEASSVIVGYKTYIDLLPKDLLRGRRVLATGMRAEIRRVQAATQSALSGEPTALVCSGDPGVYALAGLTLEYLEKRGIHPDSLPLSIIPGVPALCAAAALLGAPLTHDFACVSLSDLLTPWERIRRRLEAALRADFVLVLYNPRSSRRLSQLAEALALAAEHLAPSTPVGIVRKAFRPGQSVCISSLAEADPRQADMFTLLIIGNSETRITQGPRMLTPRGYAL